MLSEIDNQLFPDRCEVIQLIASQRFVYPIMKNGSSSFYDPVSLGQHSNFRIHSVSSLSAEERSQPFITFLRDPKKRFISGVNTYLYHLIRDNPDLDISTVLWFVDNYLFLNLHYCPQFFWLLNLAKAIGPDVKFELKSIDDLVQYTPIHSDAQVPPPTQQILDVIQKFNWNRLELYFYLDQKILEMIGQTVSFNMILNKIKQIPVLNECILLKFANVSKILNAVPSA